MRNPVLVYALLVSLAAFACGDDSNTTGANAAANVSTNGSTGANATPNAATNTETPNTETPNTETPNTETPNTETPNTETPNTETPNTETPVDTCVPSRIAFRTNALPYIEEGCGNCHGETPQFGAPQSLLDYDALIEGEVGERLVDKMATRLLDRTMPPPAAPALGHVALDTLVTWTTCGQQHADHTVGLESSRPVWAAPDERPELPTFDVTANEFEVSPTTIDRYQCFVIAAPIDEPRFIRRIEPLIDDSRVLHHALVRIDRSGAGAGTEFPCPGFPPGDDYIYAWAPGQEPLQFPEGGIRVEPGETFVLQIHYNNGAGAEDVSDSSGFRVWHGPATGKEFGMVELGNLSFPPMAPGEEGSVTWECRVDREVEVIASWPHMHEIGSAFYQDLIRVDGTTESIIELTGWQFEAQLLYDTPFTVVPGDVLRTTCEWFNTKDFTVGPGTGTADEMCFDFVYISPAEPGFCY
jgi:hypothetical protein